MQGATYGLYNTSTVNFYDGILKGKTSGYSGTITSVATDHIIATDSEEIEDETYTTNYLVEKVDYIVNESTNTFYSELQKAIDEASNGDTLKITKSSTSYESITIPSGKEITIDLGANVLEFTNGITNNGTLTINADSNTSINLKKKNSGNLITNNGTLNLTNVNIYSSSTGILNNSNATISNSIFTGYQNIKNGEKGILTITDSSLTSTYYALYNYGVFNLTNTNITANSYYAIYNYSTSTTTSTINGGTFDVINCQKSNNVEIKNATLNKQLSISSGTSVKIDGGSINNGISSSGTLTLTNTSVIGSISSTGVATLTNFDIKGSISSSGVSTISNVNISFTDYSTSSSSYPKNIISNSGTMTLDGVTISTTRTKSYDVRAIYNTSKLTATNLNINIDVDSSYKNSISYGIYNYSGTTNLNSTNINMSNGYKDYGIYVNNGTVNYKSGNIDINSATSYGIYITNGTVTMGEKEDTSSDNYGKETANVSTTDPSIKAIGSTLGIGVKKTGGYFNYYDGIITGSTSAKPETASEVEYKYQAEYYYDEDNHEYCILEYMKENIKN
jgi:hypothetical protein